MWHLQQKIRAGTGIAASITFLILGIILNFHGESSRGSGQMKPFNLHIRKNVKANLAKLDPAKIKFFQQYEILQNLLSPLVTYNDSGELVSAMASSYSWEGDSIRFKLRRYQSVDGVSVVAEDVLFTLKRLMILSGNSHGNIKHLVCGVKALKSIDDDCDGMRVDQGDLILRVNGRKAFLLPMLASIDFGVLLRSQVDPKTLEIKDFRNTSGPYYLDNGSLIANPQHWLFSSQIPQQINLVTEQDFPQKSYQNPFELFRDGLVDHISAGSHLRARDYVDFYESCESCNLRRSADLNTEILVFTERGQKELSPTIRKSLGFAVRDLLLKATPPETKYSESATNQFFQQFGEGGLDSAQQQILASMRVDRTFELPGPVIFATFSSEKSDYYTKTLGDIPNLKFNTQAGTYMGQPWKGEPDYPHLYVIPTDTTWNESISLLSYSFKMGVMPIKYGDGSQWLAAYMDEPDKVQRLKLLRQLHLDMLMDPSVVPLTIKPYFSIARKPWHEEDSRLNPVNGLWQITTH